MIDVTLTQHPVGQGGMMSGLLEVPGGRFHWLYDCGSNQIDALKREIAAVAARGPVDCLFLSHLDSDHINGIDYLLAQASVTEVVLPYLNDLDRLVAAAHDAKTGALSGGFLTFLGDMAGWFAARGVERVTFIDPRDDDDDAEFPAPEFPSGGDDFEPRESRISGERDAAGAIQHKWRGGQRPDFNVAEQLRSQLYDITVQHLATDAILVLKSRQGTIDWLLAPFAHRPSKTQLLAFRRAMYKKFGPKYLSRLGKLIEDRAVRDEIRDFYDLVWTDHNLVSMALYAGPTISPNWRGHCSSAPPGSWYHHPMGGAAGWLGTGDMHLDVGVRRKAFLRHYRELLDQVNVFGLPHHGSHRNFHPSVPGEMRALTQCVAAAGPNGYGHPNPDVIDIVHSARRQFIQVDDTGRSVLQWRHAR